VTEQLTVAETFIVELATAGVGLRLTQTIAYNLHRATTEQGWTIPQLVTEATRDLDTAANPGAVITDRIRIAATVAPPRAPRTKTGLPKAHKAGVCCDGYGIIYHEDVDPPVQSKCPGVSG
jgi:hypothetical protein